MERHDLLHEFPQYQEKIHQLKIADTHFSALFDEYHKIEDQVHRINTGEEVVIERGKAILASRGTFLGRSNPKGAASGRQRTKSESRP